MSSANVVDVTMSNTGSGYMTTQWKFEITNVGQAVLNDLVIKVTFNFRHSVVVQGAVSVKTKYIN